MANVFVHYQFLREAEAALAFIEEAADVAVGLSTSAMDAMAEVRRLEKAAVDSQERGRRERADLIDARAEAGVLRQLLATRDVEVGTLRANNRHLVSQRDAERPLPSRAMATPPRHQVDDGSGAASRGTALLHLHQAASWRRLEESLAKAEEDGGASADGGRRDSDDRWE